MIDIWMLFTMIIPLLEVSLHTYKETLNMELRKLDEAIMCQPQDNSTVKIGPMKSRFQGQIDK